MELDRKRSRGPEESGSKRSRLEKSPSTEHEISIHASYDDDLLSSPASTGVSPALERERSEGRSRFSRSPMPAAVEALPDDQSFPIAKLSRGSSEKRKERRYRGGGDSAEEREREKERDRSNSKRARRVSPSRGQVSKGESLKRSSSGRNSPQFWERERSRREEERYPRDLRHGSDEPHSLRRPEERREESRRGSFQHEKDERQYREPRRGDSRRARIEERERFVRHERYDGRPRSPRRPDRLDRRGRLVKSGHIEHDRIPDRQPSRERQHLERSGRHVGRERRSRERERHRHKKRRSHKDQVEEKSLEKGRKEPKKVTSESGSESDVTPEERKGEQESIEQLIKEIQESDSSDESSESSMEEDAKVEEEEEEEEEEGEVKAGGSSGNESDSEESLSEGGGSEQEKKKRTKRLRKVKTRSVHLDESEVSPKESGLQDIGEPLRSKFDDDEEEGEEEETDRQRHKWYSGYHEVLSEEESDASGLAELERGGGGENEGAKDEVEAEPERSPTPDLPCYYPALMGCRSVESYEWLNRIEEGTYGVVYRAKDKRNGEIVALKKLKMEKEKEGFPITSLREINMLLKAKHPNIVHVREIVVGNNMDKIYIVMDYVEHDLKALMETMQTNFLEGEVKTLMIQLLRAVHHLHDNWILHRDLKASNLLLSHKGILKVGDFGLAREYGSPLRQYTPVVVTLWYRPPELLLGAKEYSTAVDMWSVGCIFAEFMLRKPLFRGKGEIDQLNQIFKELGTPSEEIWPGYNQLPAVQKVTFTKQPYNHLRKRFPYLTKSGFDLLNRFLTYDPKKRISAKDALEHPYFKESPLPVPPHMFPTWPAKSEMSRKPKREKSPTPPEGGAFLLNKRGDDDDSPSGMGRFRMTHAQHGQAAVGAGFSLKF